jgi:hypothetical protein
VTVPYLQKRVLAVGNEGPEHTVFGEPFRLQMRGKSTLETAKDPNG